MDSILPMESSPLDAANQALSELQNRHHREGTKLAEAKERQENLREKRADPLIPYDATDQQEAIGLSHEISDGEDILADLEARIIGRQEVIQGLKKETARVQANVLVGQSLSEYDEVLQKFTEPIQRATAWLQKAHEAAGLYAKSNPGGFTSVNHQLRPRIEAMAHLLLNIENGRKI